MDQQLATTREELEKGKAHLGEGRFREALICFKNCLASCVGLERFDEEEVQAIIGEAADLTTRIFKSGSHCEADKCQGAALCSYIDAHFLATLHPNSRPLAELVLGAALYFLGEIREGLPHLEYAHGELVLQAGQTGRSPPGVWFAVFQLAQAYSHSCLRNQAECPTGKESWQHGPGVCQHTEAAQVVAAATQLPGSQEQSDLLKCLEAEQWMLAGEHGKAVEAFKAVPSGDLQVRVVWTLFDSGAEEAAFQLLESLPDGLEDVKSPEALVRLMSLMHKRTGGWPHKHGHVLQPLEEGIGHGLKGQIREAISCFKDCLVSCLDNLEVKAVSEVQAILGEAMRLTAGTLEFAPVQDKQQLSWGLVDLRYAPYSAILKSSHQGMARLILGCALGFLGGADAIPHLEAAVELLSKEQVEEEVGGLLAVARFRLKQAYGLACCGYKYDPRHVPSSICQHRKAAEMGSEDGRPYDHLLEAAHWRLAGELDRALEKYKTTLEMANQQLPESSLTGFRAAVGCDLLRLGAVEEAVKLLRTMKGDGLKTFFGHLKYYLWGSEPCPAASEILKLVDPVVESLSEEGEALWREWQLLKLSLLWKVGDHAGIEDLKERILVSDYDRRDASPTAMIFRASYYSDQGEYEAAVETINDVLEVESSFPDGELPVVRDLYAQRAFCHIMMKSYERAFLDLRSALDIQLGRIRQGSLLDMGRELVARYYVDQAIAKCLSHRFEEADSLLDRAIQTSSAMHDRVMGLRMQFRMMLLMLEIETGKSGRSPEHHQLLLREVAELNRKITQRDGAEQAALGQGMEAVSFQEKAGMHLRLFQSECGEMATGQPLLWAERARTRLLMSVKPEINSNLFDQCDRYATQICADVITACGPNTAIIVYSYRDSVPFFIAYVLFEDQASGAVKIARERVDMQDFPDTVLKDMSQVAELVRQARLRILSGSDDEAKVDLALLHRILLGCIEHYLPRPVDEMEALLFVPQGDLSSLPFAALYDERRGKFLIQQTAVGVIPGLRALHRCFQRQHLFQQDFAHLSPPFVAGNPVPMGCCYDQLPGAAEEAQEVAKLWGVEAVVGTKMTKEAVLKGLTQSGLVCIATHGDGGCKDYSQGLLVMKRVAGAYSSPAALVRSGGPWLPVEHVQVEDARWGLHLRSLLRLGLDPTDWPQDETLSGEEIGSLNVRAGMVVLSACQSGYGKVTVEGVLALGRAVLEAGAATTMVSLWPVSDEATRMLITGALTEFRGGKAAVKSLQQAMVDSIMSDKRISEWAGFHVFGSPTLRWLDDPKTPAPDYSWMTGADDNLSSQDVHRINALQIPCPCHRCSA